MKFMLLIPDNSWLGGIMTSSLLAGSSRQHDLTTMSRDFRRGVYVIFSNSVFMASKKHTQILPVNERDSRCGADWPSNVQIGGSTVRGVRNEICAASLLL